MDFRASYGEKITGDSWVMRNIWRTTDVKRGMTKHTDKNDNFYAKATSPTRLSVDSIKRILMRAIAEQEIREELADGARRHSWKQAHGMRKYYKTRAEQVMNRLNVEFLMGHSIGLNSNYYRPTEAELLTDYLKAVPNLTINDQNVDSLKEQQQVLEEKDRKQTEELEQMRERQRIYEEKMDAAEAALNRKISMIQESIGTKDQLIAEMEKTLKERYQSIEEIQKMIKDTEALRETVRKAIQQEHQEHISKENNNNNNNNSES